MATSAPSTSNTGSDHSAVEQVMTVTAVEKSQAEALLATSSGNVERAINLFFETSSGASQSDCGRVQDDSDSVPTDGPSPADRGGGLEGDEEVRAPILPRADVIAEPGHDAVNYTQLDGLASGWHSRRGFHRSRRPNPHRTDSVFDKFRDFSAEIRWQEQNLGRVGRARAGASSVRVFGAVRGGDGSSSKRRTLEEMFRPPLELLCLGTFQSARDCGVARRRWLLVNVQNTTEFACQTLNRDVWSQPAIADLVRRRFVLWQVYHESGEGLKYRTFYPVSRWPYVAALDPRTGELLHVWHWQSQDSDSVLQQLNEFLTAHTYDGDEGECPEGSSSNSADASNREQPPQKRARTGSALVDLDEDEQMRLAIERSLSADQKATAADSNDSSSSCCSPSTGIASETDSRHALTEDTESNQAAPAVLDDSDSRSGSNTESASNSVSISPTRGVSPLVNGTASLPAKSQGGASPARDATEEWKQFMGSFDDPLWTLALRLPDSRRLQLQLPCSSKLRSVQLYAEEELGCSAGSLELVTTFPRRRLSQPDLLAQTLEEVGLHSQDTLFVQKL